MSKRTEQTNEQVNQDLKFDPAHLSTLTTTSAKIRYLDSVGMKRGEICKVVFYKDGRQLRYQHVRNVLITPLKKA